MSELEPQGYVADPSRYAVAGSILGVIAAVGLAPTVGYAAEQLMPAHHQAPLEQTRPSRIVAGVLGQIEGHEGSVKHPQLLIEQCRYDVRSAYHGKTTLSFNWKLGKLGTGCYEDVAAVPVDVWRKAKNGHEIIFAGHAGTPLGK